MRKKLDKHLENAAAEEFKTRVDAVEKIVELLEKYGADSRLIDHLQDKLRRAEDPQISEAVKRALKSTVEIIKKTYECTRVEDLEVGDRVAEVVPVLIRIRIVDVHGPAARGRIRLA